MIKASEIEVGQVFFWCDGGWHGESIVTSKTDKLIEYGTFHPGKKLVDSVHGIKASKFEKKVNYFLKVDPNYTQWWCKSKDYVGKVIDISKHKIKFIDSYLIEKNHDKKRKSNHDWSSPMPSRAGGHSDTRTCSICSETLYNHHFSTRKDESEFPSKYITIIEELDDKVECK